MILHAYGMGFLFSNKTILYFGYKLSIVKSRDVDWRLEEGKIIHHLFILHECLLSFIKITTQIPSAEYMGFECNYWIGNKAEHQGLNIVRLYEKTT